MTKSVFSGSGQSSPNYLAVDWGTTNRRVYRVANGQATLVTRDRKGILKIADFAKEAEQIRRRFGDLPMLLAGMVGSDRGWRQTAYVQIPAPIEKIAAALEWIDERTAIVPGLCQTGPADVMRGEEVQFLGAHAANFAPADALLIQPGTHSKWAVMRHGCIERFSTSMTGELFELLRRHSLLAPLINGKVGPTQAFREGLEQGMNRDLLSSLFGIRAAALLGARKDKDAPGYASGLLIGAEVSAQLMYAPQSQVHILADAALGELYAIGVEAHGRQPLVLDSHAAFTAGIMAIGAQA